MQRLSMRMALRGICLALWLVAAAAMAQQDDGAAIEEARQLNAQAVELQRQGQYSQALPFALQALGIREKVLGPEHPDTATDLNDLALLYFTVGAYAKAEPLFRRALAIREKVLGPEHPVTARGLNNLAALYSKTVDYANAEPLYQRAIAIWERALGPEHPDTAGGLNNLASLRQAMGAYTNAEPLYQRALTIRAKVLGPEHPDTAQSLNNLATLYDTMGAYAKAEPLYQRALAIREKVQGLEHPDTANSLKNLAVLYRVMGAYEKAEPLFQRAWAICESVLGPEHPDTAASLITLADFYRVTGSYGKAEPLFQRGVAIFEKVLGPEHPDTANGLNNLATLYYTMGAYAKAEPLYQRALAISEKVLGPEHPDTATYLIKMALLYVDTGDYAKALPLHQRALAIREKSLGPEHPYTASSLNNLALVYHHMDVNDKAESMYRRAVTIDEKVLGPEHPDTAVSLNNLGLLYLHLGSYGKAELLFQRAIGIGERVLGPEHPDLAASLMNLAELYRLAGAYAKAEPQFRRALTILEKALGSEHPKTAVGLANLAKLYQSMGTYAKAEPLEQRALYIREKVLGPAHPDTATSVNNLAALYDKMGAYAKAEPLHQRALAVFEKVLGLEHTTTAGSLSNLATLYYNMGAYAKAEPLYERALTIRAKVLGPEHPDTAQSLNNLALLDQKMGAYAKAEPIYQRALTILETVLGPENPNFAISLQNLALLYADMGALAKAEPLYQRAQRILLVGGNADLLSTTSANLASLHSAQGRPELAIFYAKQAVALTEGQRKSFRGMDGALQTSYIGSKDSIYRELAGWLVAAGRLGEAERVLELLRVDELRNFARGSDITRQSLPFRQVRLCVDRECVDQDEFDRIGTRLGAIARDLDALRQNPQQFSPTSKNALLDERNAQLERFEKWLTSLVDRYGKKPDPEVTRKRIEDWKTSTSTLRTATLSALPSGTVALRYLVTQDALFLMVITDKTQDFREIKVREAELNKLVGGLRQAMLQRADPQPAAQALYAKLIAPVRTFLDQATRNVAQPVLMIAPDKALGMLPFAALHDGTQYLVERYALAQFNDAVRENLKDKPNTPRQRSFGVTQSVAGQQALPAVAAELAGLGQAVPGDAPVLDEAFTEAQLLDTFELNVSKSGSYPIVHIASHFRFYPGDTFSSGLLLGGGAQLSLNKLQGWQFTNTELLTLSACQTAETGGIPSDKGLTVDGFGPLAQKNGAHAVLATLWSVNDASTSELMKQFYARRYDPQRPMNKAQALRQAQMAMILGGDARATSEGQRAGSSGEGPNAQAAPQAVDPQRPHAHPFYWAPFVLMGNWL